MLDVEAVLYDDNSKLQLAGYTTFNILPQVLVHHGKHASFALFPDPTNRMIGWHMNIASIYFSLQHDESDLSGKIEYLISYSV